MGAPSHAVELTQRLIRCPSVTPQEGGALDCLQDELSALGFACERLPFGDGDSRIDNLFARRGDAARICVLLAIPTWCPSAMSMPGRMIPSPPPSAMAAFTAVVPPI